MAPWINTEGFLDPGRFPIDAILQQAMAADAEKFRTGLSLLRMMYDHGRAEAGVFLMGLLVASDKDWHKRLAIVEALSGFRTKACARLLLPRFGELKVQMRPGGI